MQLGWQCSPLTSPRSPFRTPTLSLHPRLPCFLFSTLYPSDAAFAVAVPTNVPVLVSSSVKVTTPSAESAAVSASAMESAAGVAVVQRYEENTRHAARRTGAPLQTLFQKKRHPDRRTRLRHRGGVQPPRPEGRGAHYWTDAPAIEKGEARRGRGGPQPTQLVVSAPP